MPDPRPVTPSVIAPPPPMRVELVSLPPHIDRLCRLAHFTLVLAWVVVLAAPVVWAVGVRLWR